MLIVTIPIAIGIFISAARGRIELMHDAIVVRGLWATRIPLTDVQRLGVLHVPVVGRGIGRALARKKVGGSVGVNLCVMNSQGKTRKVLASMYENYQDLISRTQHIVHRPIETVQVGLIGPKWGEPPRA